MQLCPYVMFNGNCAEAIDFYQHALGATLLFKMTYAEMPDEAREGGGCPTIDSIPSDNIMHAQITLPGGELMMSDSPQHVAPQGFSLSLSARDTAEGLAWFNALGQSGNITFPWQETFWAHGFGMVTDRFGIPWMVNVPKMP